MAKIDTFTAKVKDLLTEASIQTFTDHQESSALDFPEYAEIKSEKFSITNTIRLENGLAFGATLFCKLTVFFDAKRVQTTDLVFRAVAVISKRYPIKVKEIRYEFGTEFNKYIVDLEIGGFGWVQFDE